VLRVVANYAIGAGRKPECPSGCLCLPCHRHRGQGAAIEHVTHAGQVDDGVSSLTAIAESPRSLLDKVRPTFADDLVATGVSYGPAFD
jgi:hypothetical protein